MVDLYIFDPDDNLLAILSNEAEEACSFHSAPFEEELNREPTFQFVAYPADHPDAKFISEENQVAFLDKDNQFRLFTIKNPEFTNGDDGPEILAECVSWLQELDDEPIEDIRAYDTTLEDAMTRALAKTRVKVGTIAELGINSANFYYITVKKAIEISINTWGGELRDRIEIQDNKIIRYLDILPRRGSDTGKRWEIDKDIDSLTYRIESKPKTALYGRGSSIETDNGGFTRKISFADVEWKVANGDPVDKPVGQEWVGDPEARAKHGKKNSDGSRRHRFGFYDDGEQKDAEQLLKDTWEALQSHLRPFINAEMDVFLLENISGLEHEKARLGDTTIAIDDSFARPIELESRIIRYSYDVADPENSGEVELGSFIDLNEFESRLDDVEAKLIDNMGIWNNPPSPEMDPGKYPDIIPSQPIVTATANFASVNLNWEYAYEEFYTQAFEVFVSEIAGFAVTEDNLIYRGIANGYNFIGEANKQYYFRVRAVNYHGRFSPLSDEVSATTARIISDDILFGPDIAAELRELSKEADLLAEGSIGIDQLKQATLDTINQTAKNYTNEEIQKTTTTINNELADKAGLNYVNGKFSLVDSELNGILGDINLLSGDVSGITTDVGVLQDTASNLITRVGENEDALSAANGKLITMESNIDTIEGTLSTTINQLTNVEGIIADQQTQISANATAIELKASQDQMDTVTGDISSINATLQVQAGEINAKAERSEVYTIAEVDGKVSTEISKVKAEIKVTTDGISQSVTSVNAKIDGLQVGGRNYFVVGEATENIALLWASGGNFADTGSLTSGYIPTKPGDKFICTPNDKQAQTFFFNAKKEYIGATASKLSIVPGSTESYQYNPSTPPTDRTPAFVRIVFRNNYLNGRSKEEAKVMLEKGTMATDWTPAPEDIDDAISSVESYASSIDQKADSINLSVNSLSQTVSGHTTAISNAQSSISQLSSSITFKAEKTEVEAVQGELTSVSNQLSSLTVDVSGISTSVSSLRVDLDGIEVGGRNLLKQSKEVQKMAGGSSNATRETMVDELETYTRITTTSTQGYSYEWIIDDLSTPLVLGEDYVVSCEFRSETNGMVRFGVRNHNTADGVYEVFYPYITNLSNGSWIRLEQVFRFEKEHQNILLLIGAYEPGAKLDIKNIKVEKGNKSTSWTPAPEDFTANLSALETRIDQTSTEIALKASQTSVDSLGNRMTQAESSLSVQAGQIAAKVDKDGVISAINLSPGTVKIDAALIDLVGDVYITNGRTYISNGVVDNAAIANAAITRAKLGTAVVGTLQVEDGAITNAKIASLSADKINTGILYGITINGVTINGSIINSVRDSNTYTKIQGASVESRGRFARNWRGNNLTHDIRIITDNGHIRARNDDKDRSLYFSDFGISTQVDGINASGTLEFFSKVNSSLGRGVTLSSEGVTTIEANGGAIFLHSDTTINADSPVYLPSVVTSTTNGFFGVDGELRVVNKGTADTTVSSSVIYRDVRAAVYNGTGFSTTTTNAYIGSDGEVRMVNKGYVDGSTGNPIYRDVRANGYWGNSLVSEPGLNVYLGTDGELRVTSRGTASGSIVYRSARVFTLFADAVDVNNGTHIYLRPSSSGEARVTQTGTTGTYLPIRASNYYNGSSRTYKTNIEELNKSGLEVINSLKVVEYDLISDIEQGIFDNRQVGLISEDSPAVATSDGLSIILYKAVAYNIKGTQELFVDVLGAQEDINWLKQENQLLKARIKKLEDAAA